MSNQRFEFVAKIVKVVDGDTVDLDVDLGFKVRLKVRARLARIDTPELNRADAIEKQKAIAAKACLSGLLPVGSQVRMLSTSLDTYGRSISELWNDLDINISDEMLASGLASRYG